MEFQPVTKTVEMFGVTESKEMTIRNSAKVFYTFISGLYSRKIESICREIISNAYDGHIKRGNQDRPFFVHSPTVWEPWFAVRDYGTSIPHDTVIEYCSQIGWSSKENSNEEIGTWGYGMKSPFAYTSQFTLTCYLDGVARIYSYHIAESGAPCIVLRDTQPTDEEQGVEVRFDVKRHDMDAFQRAIRWVALPYKTCFETNLSGVHSAQITRDEDLFFVTPDTSEAMVQVGPVWYRIDFNELPNISDELERGISHTGFVLRSKIGDLGIVPSRESLEYTPKTVENLTSLLVAAHERMVSRVSGIVGSIDNVWDLAKKYREIGGGPFGFIANGFRTKWGQFGHVNSYSFQGDRGTVQEVSLLDTNVLKRPKLTFYRGRETAVYVFDSTMESVRAPNQRLFRDMTERDITDAVCVYLPDPKGEVSTLTEYFKKNNTPRAERRIKLDGLFKRLTKRRNDLLRSIKEFGCPVVVYQNELPEPYKISAEARRGAPIAVYENNGDSRWKLSSRGPVENKLNIVFELKDSTFPLSFRDYTIRHLVKKQLDMEVGDIIGVAASNYKRFLRSFPEYTGWADVFNAGNFDLPALEDRIRQFDDACEALIDYHLSKAADVMAVLSTLPVLPEAVKRIHRESLKAKEELDRRKAISQALREDDGFSESECRFLIQMITGKAPAESPNTNYDPLTKALDNLDDVYPRLDNFSRWQRDEAAIYVLGTDAFRSVRAISFHEEADDLDLSPQPEVSAEVAAA